ncbi:MAG: DUF4386 family protein [Paracoccaceae bacterium]
MSRTGMSRARQTRRSEIAIAFLFWVTAAGAIVGAALLAPVFADPVDLSGIAAARGTIATGAALWTLNNFGFVFIALFAWPVLAPVAPFAARAYLTTRVIEAGVMMLGVMALLTIPDRAAAGDGAGVALLHAVSEVSLDAGMLPPSVSRACSSRHRSCATGSCRAGSPGSASSPMPWCWRPGSWPGPAGSGSAPATPGSSSWSR